MSACLAEARHASVSCEPQRAEVAAKGVRPVAASSVTATRAPLATRRVSCTTGTEASNNPAAAAWRSPVRRATPGRSCRARDAQPVEGQRGTAVLRHDEHDAIDRPAQRIALGARIGEHGERLVDAACGGDGLLEANLLDGGPDPKPERGEPRHDRKCRERRPRGSRLPVELDRRERHRRLRQRRRVRRKPELDGLDRHAGLGRDQRPERRQRA